MNTDRITLLPSISVIVPVYNGEGTLPELVGRLEKVLRSLLPFRGNLGERWQQRKFFSDSDGAAPR